MLLSVRNPKKPGIHPTIVRPLMIFKIHPKKVYVISTLKNLKPSVSTVYTPSASIASFLMSSTNNMRL